MTRRRLLGLLCAAPCAGLLPAAAADVCKPAPTWPTFDELLAAIAQFGPFPMVLNADGLYELRPDPLGGGVRLCPLSFAIRLEHRDAFWLIQGYR